MNILNTNAAIIGGGPAGIAASLQLRKFGIDSIIAEKNKIGGLLRNAWKIENYPGFETGISGMNISEIFRKQLDYFKCKYIFDEVVRLEFDEKNSKWNIFSQGRLIYADFVIIAAGTLPVKPKPFLRSGLIFNEYAKMHEIRNKAVGVVGSGDAAFDNALSLFEKDNSVEILIRNDNIKCNSLLKEEAEKRQIKFRINYNIISLEEKNRKIIVAFSNDDILKYDYLLYAVGREPDYRLIQNIDFQNYQGKSLFMIGDMINGNRRQSSISISQGVDTAMEIFDIYSKNKLHL